MGGCARDEMFDPTDEQLTQQQRRMEMDNEKDEVLERLKGYPMMKLVSELTYGDWLFLQTMHKSRAGSIYIGHIIKGIYEFSENDLARLKEIEARLSK